jgi:hypothetical protein
MRRSDRDDTPELSMEPLRPETQSTQRAETAAGVVGLWYILGPVVLLLVVLGLGVWFLADGPRDAHPGGVPGVTGTTGEDSPGGYDPSERPDTTEDELRQRGQDGAPRD